MQTTLNTDVPPYIGADLTDRYSNACRAIDVCGLDADLNAQLWLWHWDAGPDRLAADPIYDELAACRSAMLDGPQGLAEAGESLRMCERESGAAGKTPDVRPRRDRPFATYIWSSLDLFQALFDRGMAISPPEFVDGVSEVYPGHIWTVLAGRSLPKKGSHAGRCIRKKILECLGIKGLPMLPSHDENDACIAAAMAAAADGKIPGLTVVGIGRDLVVDPEGVLREGRMVIPQQVDAELRERIDAALANEPVIQVAAPRARSGLVPRVDADGVADRAKALLECFIERAAEGNAQICTYSWAYRAIFDQRYETWAQGYADQVIRAASSTPRMDLPGLGAVQLDAFIVARTTRMPSGGHWRTAEYEAEDWERVLGTAALLH